MPRLTIDVIASQVVAKPQDLTSRSDSKAKDPEQEHSEYKTRNTVYIDDPDGAINEGPFEVGGDPDGLSSNIYIVKL